MIHLFPHHLRTSTVSALCRGMAGDYSAWPLLRDALQDAGAEPAELAPVYMLGVMLDKEDDEAVLAWAECVGGERGRHVCAFVEFDRAVCNHDWTLKPRLNCGACNAKTRIWEKNIDEDGIATWDPEIRSWVPKPFSPNAVDWHRGFIRSLTCSWSDWLAHHGRLYWNAGQRVPCKKCGGRKVLEQSSAFGDCKVACLCGSGMIPRPLVEEVECRHDFPEGDGRWFPEACPSCSGTGRIHRSVLDTVQPLECVRLSSVSEALLQMDTGTMTLRGTAASGAYRFTRMKCPTCGGAAVVNTGMAPHDYARCPGCNGTNRWQCEAWTGLVFEMAEEPRGR